jgi:hypothetical protein
VSDNFVQVDNISNDITETASLSPKQITRGPGASIGVAAASQAYRADGKKPEELPVYRTLGQILHIKQALTMQYAARDVVYRFLERIYDGDAWRWIMEDLRYNRMNKKRYAKDDQYRLVVNYVFSVVNDYVDLLSKDPSIHVPVLYPADPASQDHAALVEKAYYGFWYASKMERQRYDLAWYLALLGSAGIESTPDPDDGIPKLLVKHPGSLYVRARFGRPDEILYVIERFFLDPDQIADAYGDAWKDNGMFMTLDSRSGQWLITEDWTPNMTKVEGFIFHTPWEKTVVIQNRILDEYSVQFEEPRPVPYRIIPFIKRPGRQYGIGAAEQIWGLNQYMNQLYSQEANILAYAANPIMVVKEPTQVPANIPNDPGAVVSVGPQGDVKWLQWHGAVPEVTQQLDRTKKYLQDISGMPETRYGGTKQSFVTGRAVEELNAPTQDRIASRYRLIASELSAINEIAMWQFEKISKNKKVSLYGFDGAANTFSMEVAGKDIKGYRRNIITWDNHDHADAVEVLQLVGANLLDKYSGLIKLGVREPQQVIKRIREDRLEDIEFARQLELAKLVSVSPQASQALLPGQDSILGAQGQQQIAQGLMAGSTGQPAPGQPPLGAPGGPSGEGGAAAPAPNSPAGPANGSPSGMAPNASQGAAPLGAPPAPSAPGVHRSGFGPSANLHLAGSGGGGNFDLQHVTNDFMALPPDKIKGKVYLIGAIAQGAANKIEIFLTIGNDKKTLIDLLPQYKGHMDFTVGTKAPAHAVDVTPKAFSAPPKNQQPGVGNVPQSGELSPLEPKGGQTKNPPGLVLGRGPGGIPTGYSSLPQVPPGQGAPSEVNP